MPKAITTIFFFLFVFCCSTILSVSVDANQQNKILQKKVTIPLRKTVKILAIDGGGIRGIIPALVLKDLESRLKDKKLSECFDVMSGTSTGGLIVLMLNVPDFKGEQKYRARDIVKLYKSFGETVFYQSLWQKIVSLDGWISAKYASDRLETFLKSQFAETRLSDAISNIIIPAYNIESDKTFFFKKRSAQKKQSRDFYFRDIGRAASAAPTYFKPVIITDLSEQEHCLIDGGVASNNPALAAYQHAYEIYGSDCDYVVVSLGTGTFYGAPQKIIQTNPIMEQGGILQWMRNDELISLMLYGGNDVADYRLSRLLNNQTQKKYFRFQAILENIYTATDNVSLENIKALEKYAHKIIEKHGFELKEIAKMLEE